MRGQWLREVSPPCYEFEGWLRLSTQSLFEFNVNTAFRKSHDAIHLHRSIVAMARQVVPLDFLSVSDTS